MKPWKPALVLLLFIGWHLVVSAQSPAGSENVFKTRGILPIFEFQGGKSVWDEKYLGEPYEHHYWMGCLKVTLAYQFNAHFSLGQTFGFQSSPNEEGYLTGLDARYAFSGRRLSPVFACAAGVRLNDDLDRNIWPYYINPSIGGRLYLNKDLAFFLSLGYQWEPYKVQRAYFNGNLYDDPKRLDETWWNYLTMQVGLGF